MSRRALPVLAVVLIVVGLVGLAVAWTYLGSSNAPGWMGTRDVDAMFIEEMIPHHEDAIAMAKAARTKAEHPEIRRLASDIERTQSAENTQMRAWYREWFDAEVPEGGSTFGMMSGGVDMDDFEASEPFDKAFIEEMIPHHEMALMMSTMLSRRSDRAEMHALAESIIDAQSREIDQMRAWYSEWYGR